MLTPDYYDEFRCIGADCEDTCCSSLDIMLDRDLYSRLKSNRDHMLGDMFQIHIVRNETVDATTQHFARILRRSNGACPFHGEDKLCLIHKNLGENWLPNVCATYPRTGTVMEGTPEAGLSVSCPEAARIVLLRSEPIGFQHRDMDQRLLQAPHQEFSFQNELVGRWASPIRALCIRILQDRYYSVDARLLLLSEFISAAEYLLKNIEENQLTKLIESVEKYWGGSYNYLDQFNTYPINTALKIQIMTSSIVHVFKSHEHQQFRQFVIDALSGLGLGNFNDEVSYETMEQNYSTAYSKDGSALLARFANLFENYLVNLAFLGLFPFGSGESLRMFDHCRGLIVNYSIMKYILIGLSAHRVDVEENDVLTLAQSFSRWADHSANGVRSLHEMHEERGWNTLSSMSVLLREG